MGLNISFKKMVASGNDFVIIDNRRQKISGGKPSLLAKQICNRKFGVGADGLLLLEKCGTADIRMRIFNPDGSEPDMCGNGIRCAALYAARRRISIQTAAGIIEAKVDKRKSEIKVKMSQPRGIRLDMPIKINNRKITASFINTGVPHTVIFVEGIKDIDVFGIGRKIRFYKSFMPQGTNVDFVQVIDDNTILLRTYERGVEDETLACGTGTVAAALVFSMHYSLPADGVINVHTRSGEILKVRIGRVDNKFADIWLEGHARVVYSGGYYV